MRSPTIRRIGVSGTISSAIGMAVVCGDSFVAARNTSLAKTLPSGPLPLREARLTPFSRAIRLAAGDASKRPLLGTIEGLAEVAGAAGAEVFVSMETGAGATDFGSGAGDSPGARNRANLCPIGTSWPDFALTCDQPPDAGASVSTVALSVSISISGSPLATD